jgi:hypothetical protein
MLEIVKGITQMSTRLYTVLSNIEDARKGVSEPSQDPQMSAKKPRVDPTPRIRTILFTPQTDASDSMDVNNTETAHSNSTHRAEIMGELEGESSSISAII